MKRSRLAVALRLLTALAVVGLPGLAAGIAPAAASALGDLAASMAPGTWAELETKGLTPDLLQVPRPTMVYNVLEYQNSGVWDPTSRQVLFIGGPHDGLGKFITYDEATNTWRQEPDPQPQEMLSTHGYDHNTINPRTGDFFFRPYDRPDIWRYNIPTRTWSRQTRIPNVEYNCCGAIEYFPDRNGILFVGRNEIAFYSFSWRMWSSPMTTVKTGPYHATAEYSPVDKVMVFGGGSGVNTIYVMDAKGNIKRGADSPVPLDSGGHAIFTADPASGKFLLFG